MGSAMSPSNAEVEAAVEAMCHEDSIAMSMLDPSERRALAKTALIAAESVRDRASGARTITFDDCQAGAKAP